MQVILENTDMWLFVFDNSLYILQSHSFPFAVLHVVQHGIQLD